MAKTSAQKKAATARKERVMADAERAMQDAPTARGIRYMRLSEGLKTFRPKAGSAYDAEVIPFQLTKRSMEFKQNAGDVGNWVPRRVTYVHYEVGPDKDQILCPAKNFGKPCAICEYRNQLRVDNPKVDYKTQLKPLEPRERTNMLLRVPNETGGRSLFLYEDAYFNFCQQLDDKINQASEKRKDRYKKYWYPDGGSTLRIVAKEKTTGGATARPYTWCTVDEIEQREEPLPDDVLDHGYHVDDMFIVKSYDEIKRIFLQVGGGSSTAAAPAEPAADETTDGDDVVWAKGDLCEYEYKKKTRTGKITKINAETQVATIKEDETGEMRAMDIDDLREPAEDEEEEDEETDDDAEEGEEEESEDEDGDEEGDEDEDSDDEDEDAEEGDEESEEEDSDEDDDSDDDDSDEEGEDEDGDEDGDESEEEDDDAIDEDDDPKPAPARKPKPGKAPVKKPAVKPKTGRKK